ncbi:hypothetical protein ACS5NO_31940 [Larkinella sp. GY13]|uniref:hypothetical protein n=1 Tax=Larkinella sp. GY13 TaxID=3453720 RepID=UPI003EE8C01C
MKQLLYCLESGLPEWPARYPKAVNLPGLPLRMAQRMKALWLTFLAVGLFLGSASAQVGGTAPGADFDGDGVINSVDLDDDNDGILDTVESPGCFYTAAEATRIVSITSGIAEFAGQPLSNAIDGVVGNGVSSFATTSNAIAGVTIFQVTPTVPVAISSLNLLYAGNTFSTAVTSTMVLQGFDGSTWVNLSNPQSYPGGVPNVTITIDNTFQPNVKYQQYRVQGVAGTIGYTSIFELTLSVSASFDAQNYPKTTCSPTADADGDTFANHLDLDSDNDACSDANEYYGLPTADGGDGGVFGTGVPTVSTTGKVTTASYTGTYSLANNAALNVCNGSAPPSCTPAQQLAQQRYWAFGLNAGIDFGASLNAPTSFVTSLQAAEGSAVATNSAGELLFYVGAPLDYNTNPSVLTSNVYDATGAIMTNGTGLLQHPSMTQGNVAYQSPGNPDKYFIIANNFALEQNPLLGNLTYSVVDMCSKSVTQKNIQIDSQIFSEAMIAVPSSDPTKFWVFAATNNNNQVLAYQFDANGYTGVRVTSSYIASPTSSRVLRLSPDGTKMMLVSSNGFDATLGWHTTIDLFDFNATTGQVNLLWSMDYNDPQQAAYGGDFSPDGNLIYVSGLNSFQKLFQFTIAGKTSGAQVFATKVDLGNAAGLGGQVVRGPDGKMYVASYGLGTLGVINSPNTVGVGANFVPTGFALSGGTTSTYGLAQTAFGCAQPAARFTFNCSAGATASGVFLANGVTGQTGTLTIPISVSVAGSVAVTVTGTGFTTNPAPVIITLTAGQTSMTIPVVYDGSGVAGVRTLTLTSPQVSGSCSLTGVNSTCTVPVTVQSCPTITNVSANNTNPTFCSVANGSIKICGLPANSTGHSVTYEKDNVAQTALGGLTADATGCLVIPNLGAGTYTNIKVTNLTCTTGSNTLGPITLTDPAPPAAPVPSLTSTTICSGNQVAINYTTSPVGAQTQWTRMPGGQTGLGNVLDFPTATGTTPVSYTYTAIVTGTFGCPSLSAVTTVQVDPVPIITPSICSQTICIGQTGAITFVSSIPGSTINWLRVEDGATGTGNISSLFATAGNFTYKVWGVSPAPASCPSSTTITCTILVNNCCDLVATAVPTSVTSCLSPNSGSILVTYTGSQTYQYSVNGGAAQPLGTSPFTIANLAPGSYTVVVQAVGDPTCTTALSATINSPTAPTVMATSNSPLCSASTLSLSATSGFTTYAWSGPNGFVSALQNPTIPTTTTAASGVYSVTATNAAGCTASSSTTVTIATQPSLSISTGSGLTICSGQSTTLAVAGDGGATVTWINNLGQSGTGTTINFAGISNLNGVPQTITYIVTAQAGNCSDTEVVTLTINPAPALQVIPRNAIICLLEQTNIVATAFPPTATLNWTRTPATPDPPASTGTGTGSVTINQVLPVGTYLYTFTATQNGCTSAPITSQITVNN